MPCAGHNSLARRPDISGVFCGFPTSVSLTAGERAERVDAELVSGTYFSVLGVRMALGHPFTPDEDRTPDGAPLAILNYSYWKQRFGGDPGILGKRLTEPPRPNGRLAV